MHILAALYHSPTLALFVSSTEKPHRMHSRTSLSADHARILDYWVRRRHGLSAGEWEDFYRRTLPILMSTQLPPEYADGVKRRNLVDIFFAEKIFLNASASRAGPLDNVHALHAFLKRFALDLQRRGSHLTALEDLPDELAAETANSEHHAAAPVSCAQMLAEAGIDADGASRSAAQFIEELDAGEAAYLRYHTCAEQEEKEPLSSIAQRLALGSSYHYKAKSLGISRSKGETYVGYEKTKIGRWLLSVGAMLNKEWQEELAVLLTLLCLQAHARGRNTP